MTTNQSAQKNIDTWLHGKYDEKTKEEIRKLQKEKPDELMDAFSTHLTFGTGGLRGIMGPGTNRMNQYTVSSATQGLSNYINQAKKNINPSVLIGFDSRNNSQFFAEIAARVFAANNIKVYLYKELRPVPMVSFGCRHQKCQAAIMITASHNPPEYNGYKVYWEDGAQVLPPHDHSIIEEVKKINSPDQIKILDNLDSKLIHHIDHNFDRAYLDSVRSLQFYPDQNKLRGEKLKIIYTPIHGSGITMVPKILRDWGFTNLTIVSQQESPDGNFPTVEKPNPEEEGAMKMGLNLMQTQNADILLGTDPDCDRIGVGVMHECKAALLSGNEVACICIDHICETLTEHQQMPANGAFIKTIVTSELFKAIALAHHKRCFNVLTGFKYIGELIKKWKQTSPPSFEYLFGGEESYGYLLGTHSRDKDAIIMSALISEISLKLKLKGKTLIDQLHTIYKKYGCYREKLTSIVYPDSQETKIRIQKMIEKLRGNPPKEFAGIPVKILEDYKTSKKTDFATGNEDPITLPQSNVLLFWLEDDTKLVIRPSGTEPKVKLYCGVVDKETKNTKEATTILDKKLETLVAALKQLLK